MAAAFSYAQAAKGIVSTQVSKTADELGTTVSKIDEQNESTGEQVNADAVLPKHDTPNEAENVTVSTEKELSPTASKASISGTSSPSVGTSQTATTKDEEGSNAPNDNSESTWDKQSQASASEVPNSTADGVKEKSSEMEKPAPPKELRAAPLPSVNIWHQRKEAQEAKAKAVAALKPTSTTKTGTSKPTTETISTNENLQEQPKTGSKKKGGDASEGGKDRKKADGAKARGEIAAVPPVGDAALWPTPQVAQGEEKKKTQAEKSPVIRPHGKEKWMPVPYVPTAVFNTPLPSAARRGGRAGRVGRDSARNGAGATADKTTPVQVSQGSTAKPTSVGDRGRNEPNSARANSLPAPSRRSNSTDNVPVDTRKPQQTDRTRGPRAVESTNATPKNVNGGESFPRHAKSFPRNHDGPHKGGDNNPRNQVDTQAGPRSGANHERRFENGQKAADSPSVHPERDRKDSHKEKEFPRESRADRGRGSHRGRGAGHSAYNGAQNSHFSNNNHMSHHNFMHNKSFGFNDRQRSQQHGITNGSRGHPMALRSPSLPNSNAMYYTFPTEINTMYNNYQPIPPGPMTAVPFQPYMEQYSLMGMISMQLEYYFSVDNLCKDLYLRKHMDSQGFVALNFIASFKRIKNLTEDFELIRLAARQLGNVDYHVGKDGFDRLRARGGWEQWVLPVDQRDPSAQNAGPVPSSLETPVSRNHLDGATNGFIPSSLHQSLPNGTSEHRVSKTTPLSSAAPEFSPSNGVLPGGAIFNRAD